LLLIPSAVRTARLGHGVRAVGVIDMPRGRHDGPPRVRFTVAVKPVSAPLPDGTDVHGLANGDKLAIRYQPGHPRRIAAQRDLGAGPIAFDALFGGVGVLSTVWGIAAARSARRRRHLAHPAAVRAARLGRP
jgi:hypothetical protein